VTSGRPSEERGRLFVFPQPAPHPIDPIICLLSVYYLLQLTTPDDRLPLHAFDPCRERSFAGSKEDLERSTNVTDTVRGRGPPPSS